MIIENVSYQFHVMNDEVLTVFQINESFNTPFTERIQIFTLTQ